MYHYCYMYGIKISGMTVICWHQIQEVMQRFRQLFWTIKIYSKLCAYMIDKYLILCLANIEQSKKYIIFYIRS